MREPKKAIVNEQLNSNCTATAFAHSPVCILTGTLRRDSTHVIEASQDTEDKEKREARRRARRKRPERRKNRKETPKEAANAAF